VPTLRATDSLAMSRSRGSARDAEAELARLLNDANRGMLIDATKITVADHMTAWLKDKELSGATRESYEMIVRAFIVPALGAIELQKLKPKDVKGWIGDLRQGPRGRRKASTVPTPFASCWRH
jgi:Phage integrase, N-terminal SAM-like domain